MPSSSFLPFRVEFTITTPMVMPTQPIHLDALLAFASVQRSFRQGNAMQAEDMYAAQTELPLACVPNPALPGGVWFWKASQVQLQYKGRDMLMMSRPHQMSRWAADRDVFWQGRKNIIPDGNGSMMSLLIRKPLGWVASAHAWGVGDLPQVRDLLGELDGLGPLTRNGWGRIGKIVVVEDTTAEVKWRQRTLPAAMAEDFGTERHVPGTGCIRAPYWRREDWQSVVEWV